MWGPFRSRPSMIALASLPAIAGALSFGVDHPPRATRGPWARLARFMGRAARLEAAAPSNHARAIPERAPSRFPFPARGEEKPCPCSNSQ